MGFTKAVHASVITEQPKLASFEFTPLIVHFEAVVVVDEDVAATSENKIAEVLV